MASQRHLGRQRAVQALFSLEASTPDTLDRDLADFWASVEDETQKQARTFAEELVRGVVVHRAALDQALQEQSVNWRLERMARVDRYVLRLGAFELLHTGTPARVVINEAVEVARIFGGEGSPAFVNGILDKLARAHARL